MSDILSTRPGAAARRNNQRGADTRARLVEAALHEFAQKGFAGASTRAIAKRAEVMQPAVRHHFATKEALWKAAVEHVFGLLRQQFEERVVGLRGVDAQTRAKLLVRDFVFFAADHPELHRLMLQEGTAWSPRLAWLVENHVRPLNAFLAEQSGADADNPPPPHLLYMVIGSASTPYALAPEYELTTGEDPFAKENVEAHADAVVALFFPDAD